MLSLSVAANTGSVLPAPALNGRAGRGGASSVSVNPSAHPSAFVETLTFKVVSLRGTGL